VEDFLVINKALWDFLASIYKYDKEMDEGGHHPH